jgi:ribonuclease P protein component
VQRHRVIRRLRHLVRGRLCRLPAGALVVVRALPAARDADSITLGRDFDAALARLLGRTAEPAGPVGGFSVGDSAGETGAPDQRSVVGS